MAMPSFPQVYTVTKAVTIDGVDYLPGQTVSLMENQIGALILMSAIAWTQAINDNGEAYPVPA